MTSSLSSLLRAAFWVLPVIRDGARSCTCWQHERCYTFLTRSKLSKPSIDEGWLAVVTNYDSDSSRHTIAFFDESHIDDAGVISAFLTSRSDAEATLPSWLVDEEATLPPWRGDAATS